MNPTSSLAAESGHWYTKDGTPAYEVENKSKGGMRPTTVRDARKLGLVPSATTIAGILRSQGLERWKCEQWAYAARSAPEIEDDEEWLAYVSEKAQEISKAASETGTAIHAAIEASFAGDLIPEAYLGHAFNAGKAVEQATGIPLKDWSSERSFASPLGYAGKIDLSSAWGVIDFKTTTKPNPRLWDSHSLQVSAYLHGMNNPGKGAIVYINRDTGLASFMEIEASELEWGWEAFQALLATWRAVNRYDPR